MLENMSNYYEDGNVDGTSSVASSPRGQGTIRA
jgi:hypothetical protein